MNYREVFLLNSKTLVSSGVENIDLDVTDPITEILIHWATTNSTAAVDDTKPQESLTKIEIVDGGKVYWNAPGNCATGVACYTLEQYINHWYNEQANAGQSVDIPMRFGRYLGDLEYNFDPRLLTNPQLRLTWSNTTGLSTTGTSVEVSAKLLEGVSGAGQAIMTRDIKQWATADSGIEPIDFPVDRMLRRLFIRANTVDTYFGSIFTNFELDCDKGKLIVFNWEDSHLLRYLATRFGFFELSGVIEATDAEYKRTEMGHVDDGYVEAWDGAPNTFGLRTTAPHYAIIYAHEVSGSALTDQPARMHIRGYLPEHMACYEFGDPMRPDTWFNAPQYKGIKLKITEGNAGATAHVLVEEPVSIP